MCHSEYPLKVLIQDSLIVICSCRLYFCCKGAVNPNIIFVFLSGVRCTQIFCQIPKKVYENGFEKPSKSLIHSQLFTSPAQRKLIGGIPLWGKPPTVMNIVEVKQVYLLFLRRTGWIPSTPCAIHEGCHSHCRPGRFDSSCNAVAFNVLLAHLELYFYIQQAPEELQ